MERNERRLLRIFLMLMAERNVSRAAERLGLSQPATSHALKSLRDLFGDSLLVPTCNGMLPTDRAMELESQVRRLLEDYDRLIVPEGRFDPSTSNRSFVLTAPEYAERLLLPPILRILRSQAPGIRIEVHKASSARVVEQLERGEIDLRIAWVQKAPSSMRSRQLFKDRIVCIADRNHPHIQGNISIDQYLNSPHVRVLGAGKTTTSHVIDTAVERLGARLTAIYHVQNLLSIAPMVAGTDIIASLPGIIASDFSREYPLQILEVPLTLPRICYAAYWHERSQNDSGHLWLRGVLVKVSQALRQGELTAARR